jgi:hypothetical protein
MAEGMMSYYSYNSFTMFYTGRTKRHLHSFIQCLGAILAIAGTVVAIVKRWGGTHFTSNHAILGEPLDFYTKISLSHFIGFQD